KLAIIYGENGSGKSNIVTTFYTLAETLRTMSIRDIIQEHLENNGDDDTVNFMKFIKQNFKDIESIIKANKTINSKDNMRLEFGFNIDGDNGSYIIEMDDNRIVKEVLDFKIEKNKGNYFEITEENIKSNKKVLNEKIFKNKSYYSDMITNIEKFWGKHSLLSILLNEINDKADGYVEGQINNNLFKVINFLNSFSCSVKVGKHRQIGRVGLTHKILKELQYGEINEDRIDELNKAEEMLNELFTKMYSDIKEIYYKTEKNGAIIKYNLYCKKMIAGEIREIDFEFESTGTQNLLDLVPYILAAVKGDVVIIDEFDSGIHDLLVKNILVSINEAINGQLIVSTHNTMIMESEIDKDSLYFIVVDLEARKKILCISDFEDRTHPNNNIRNRYLKGMYQAIPSMMDIDFEELLDILD
ncbi:MAG: AAA family ATPase, partial [Clostridium sp.]